MFAKKNKYLFTRECKGVSDVINEGIKLNKEGFIVKKIIKINSPNGIHYKIHYD